jgi:hypothetical protein
MQQGGVAGAPRLDADTLNKALGELASRQRQGEKALWVLKHTAPSETDAESLVGFTPQTAHTPRSITPALEHPGQAYGSHGAGWGLPHAGPSGESAARAPAGPAGRPDAGLRHRSGSDTTARPGRDRRWLHNGASRARGKGRRDCMLFPQAAPLRPSALPPAVLTPPARGRPPGTGFSDIAESHTTESPPDGSGQEAGTQAGPLSATPSQRDTWQAYTDSELWTDRSSGGEGGSEQESGDEEGEASARGWLSKRKSARLLLAALPSLVGFALAMFISSGPLFRHRAAPRRGEGGADQDRGEEEARYAAGGSPRGRR